MEIVEDSSDVLARERVAGHLVTNVKAMQKEKQHLAEEKRQCAKAETKKFDDILKNARRTLQAHMDSAMAPKDPQEHPDNRHRKKRANMLTHAHGKLTN